MTSTPAKSAASGSPSHSAGLVGLCAWLVPGLGYWIMGQKSRGLTVGIAILALFAIGVLVGGIRISDPPGWGQFGYRVQLVNDKGVITRVDPTSPDEEQDPALHLKNHEGQPLGWALEAQPTAEITDKPWFVGQILCGPISLAAAALSVHEAHPINPIAPGEKPLENVAASLAHSWEIGTLYTAVAGMLNLLAIIDSAYRATQPEEQ